MLKAIKAKRAKNQAIRKEATQIFHKIGTKAKDGSIMKPNAVGTPARVNREFKKIYKQVKKAKK